MHTYRAVSMHCKLLAIVNPPQGIQSLISLYILYISILSLFLSLKRELGTWQSYSMNCHAIILYSICCWSLKWNIISKCFSNIIPSVQFAVPALAFVYFSGHFFRSVRYVALRCARKYAAIFRGCFIYCLQFAARLLAHPPPSLSLFAIIFFLAFFYAQLVRFL